MWINKEEYEELIKEKDFYQAQAEELGTLCDEYKDDIMYRNDAIESLNAAVTDFKEENNKLLDIIRHLEDTLDHVIDTTFTDNRCFETVIFQRYAHAPIVYYKGKRVKSDLSTKIHAIFSEGQCKMHKTDNF